MRPDLVVIPPPGPDRLPCSRQGSEPVLVQALIPHLAVEALDEGILDRLPRLDEMQFYPSLASPDVQRLAREMNIVDDYSRECVAAEVDTSIPGARVVRVLEQLAGAAGSAASPGHRQRAGVLLSNAIIPRMLLRSLERRYPPLLAGWEGSGQGSSPRIKDIVVLGGGFQFDLELPPISQLGEDTMFRLAEGVRLYRKAPGAKLILSGGAPPGRVPEAAAMAQVAEALGVSPQDILVERSRATPEAKLGWSDRWSARSRSF